MAFGSDMFTLDSLMFCKAHGNEFCNHCCCDHRMCNNILIQDEYPQSHLKLSDDRTPISNIWGLCGPVKLGVSPQDGEDIYGCKTHKLEECRECFNWVEIMKKTEHKKKSVRKVRDRTQLLEFLRVMGAPFPQETKLKDAELEKRLTSAITSCQNLGSYGASSIDPSKLPKWPSNDSAVQCMRRFGSIAEAMEYFDENGNMRPARQLPPDNALTDARQSMMHLVKNFGEGRKTFILQDEASTEAICVRTLDILKLDKDTPLVLLIYELGSSSSPSESTLDFVTQEMRNKSLGQLRATVEEQALFRKLLADNSIRVSPSYKPKKERHERTFKLSFIVPVARLSQVESGRITRNLGCILCGEKADKRCSQCLSISYCSAECQKSHWKEHKTMCKSLKGGTWAPLIIKTEMNINGQRAVADMYSYHAPMSKLGVIDDSRDHIDGIPENAHGDQPFIIKLQRPMDPPGARIPGPMLVYDRQRTFKAYSTAVDNSATFTRFIDSIKSTANTLKAYRWARRVGSHELSVCLDREPSPVPTW
ncbi:hypothetical protein CYLTODRAFT_365815 [Cylindrobasidium torrendii FP15055 ss-10]|uniref:MYND-type domain-containing protein n=1 Tax=Cylindrobasidium torrendii FP15055 ss-10 TaxID=1314674 RepID=A0A0D7BT36_9AGAR|nr:hypothetical protein CYLTODRAFT_365815 [Cylindrobasidium torrendii FP15055 ss-10]